MKKLLLFLFTGSLSVAFSQWQSTTIFTTGEDVYCAFGKVLAADDASSTLDASTDNGANWVSSNTGAPSTGLKFGVLNGSTLYAYKNNTIYQSTTGNNWTANNTSAMAANDVVRAITVVNGTVLAVAGPSSGPGSKIFQLSGTTWSLRASHPSPLISTIKNLNGTLWAGTTTTLVLKSTDGGLTFTAGAPTLNPTQWYDKYVFCLGATPSAIFFGTYGGRIFKSTDNGSTWSTCYNAATGNAFAITDIYTDASNNLMVACDSGFLASSNSGASWTKSNGGFSYPNFDYELGKVSSNGSYLFAATKSGKIYRRPVTEIFSGINELEGNTVNVSAFPNPALVNVRISAPELINEKDCSVKLFDVLGREISNQNLNNGEVIIDVESFQNGIYYYTVLKDNRSLGAGKLIVH